MEDREVGLEDVGLPPMQPHHRNPSSNSSLDRIYGRLPSSDPPVFSSDDPESASSENYKANAEGASKRRRTYRETWWGETLDSKNQRNELETKEVDSGVWMNANEDSSAAGDAAPGGEGQTEGEDG